MEGVSLSVSDLAAQLERDSDRQMPPFGADSIRLARALGAEATDLLLQKIRGGATSAFLALEALREADPPAFAQIPAKQRAEIYVGELRRNFFFNAWGLPSHRLTPTSRALIALGEAAVPVLAGLLTNRSEAPLEGSEDATTSSAYGNRICDYAWAFINEIRRIPYRYVESVAERDEGIKSLLLSLQPGSEEPS